MSNYHIPVEKFKDVIKYKGIDEVLDLADKLLSKYSKSHIEELISHLGDNKSFSQLVAKCMDVIENKTYAPSKVVKNETYTVSNIINDPEEGIFEMEFMCESSLETLSIKVEYDMVPNCCETFDMTVSEIPENYKGLKLKSWDSKYIDNDSEHINFNFDNIEIKIVCTNIDNGYYSHDGNIYYEIDKDGSPCDVKYYRFNL